jgi:AcrR family transcriptional regulator
METKVDKILNATFELFHQHGFKKVTMSDIASASQMSRPTLYAAFSSKEAIIAAIADRQTDRCHAETTAQMPRAKTLEAQLTLIFQIWVIAPFSTVIDSPSGVDLLRNAALYAPEACDRLYARLEAHLREALERASKPKRALAARDQAHILMLATKGLKATTTTLAELRRLTAGLTAMAVATASLGRTPG